MGFQTDVLEGFAQLLDAANVAVWNASGNYTANQVGIVIQVTPTTPDGILKLSTYPVSDDPSLSDSVLGLQVQARMGGEDPRSTNDLADAAFDVIHGMHGVTLATGIRVVEALHRGGALLGEDDLHRWSRSDNYYVTLWRPSPNRT